MYFLFGRWGGGGISYSLQIYLLSYWANVYELVGFSRPTSPWAAYTCLFRLIGIFFCSRKLFTSLDVALPKIRNNIPRNETVHLVPNFYILVSGSDLCIPTIGITWNLIRSQSWKEIDYNDELFPFMICNFLNWKFECWSYMWTLGSTAGEEGRAGNCRQPLFAGSSLSFSPLLWLSRDFYNSIQQKRDSK